MPIVDKDKLPKSRYIFCNTCKTETNHVCEAHHYRDYIDEDAPGQVCWVETVGYRFWICAGCEAATLEKYYNDMSFGDNPDDITYIPERTALHVGTKQFKQLPKKLAAIYVETLHAYNNNLPVLCAIGIRALLEGICADKGIAGSNLEKKIENMLHILPANIVANLHSLRFIGNEAAHELNAPKMQELRLAIEICEDLLNFLYELDYKARILANSYQKTKP
jgi:hypothetical protein